MRKGWFIPFVALLTLVTVAIGFVGYLKYVYDQRRSADEAILKKVNLEVGILSREGYVYHVIFTPPFNKNFRDEDLRHLAEIKHLEIIWVQNIPFTDRSLEELARLKNLRFIDLGNTNVTDAGVDRLRKALPQTQILVARP
jgi:hypothetical protein